MAEWGFITDAEYTEIVYWPNGKGKYENHYGLFFENGPMRSYDAEDLSGAWEGRTNSQGPATCPQFWEIV